MSLSKPLQLAIVQNPNLPIVMPFQKTPTDGRVGKVLLEAKLLPYVFKPATVEDPECLNYCKQLNDILGKDESGKEKMWQVCANFQWEPNRSLRLKIRLHGRLLQELWELCGEFIRFTLEYTLKRPNHCSVRFTARSMRVITNTSEVESYKKKEFCFEFNPIVEAYCEDFRSCPFKRHESAEQLEVTVKALRFEVNDAYINYPIGEGGSVVEWRAQRDILKSIMAHVTSSDIFIQIQDVENFQVDVHKCFLIAHSPVLKKMVEQSRFGRLKLTDISKTCVIALVEYIYTFQISRPVKSSMLAVELFAAATKYEIYPLQEKLGRMMLERIPKWFCVTALIMLFLCIRKLGRANLFDELMKKTVQCLKRVEKKVIMKSTGYKMLMADDVNAAAELCSAMSNTN